jgi:hypothetical protein
MHGHGLVIKYMLEHNKDGHNKGGFIGTSNIIMGVWGNFFIIKMLLDIWGFLFQEQPNQH